MRGGPIADKLGAAGPGGVGAMCGIAAALGDVDEEIVAALRRVGEAQRHRGPDDDGLWRDDGVVLAHRRLSIIDLSADGHQPMWDPERRLAIVYNGEVYNYRALRAELESGGERFRSKTDTEVVMKAYARWGEACVERFRGMFALAIWDAERRELFLARDRLGIKPLYYHRVEREGGRTTLLIASEVRALLASGLVPRRLDPDVLASFAWNGFVRGARSIVRGVSLLPPGTCATVGSAPGPVVPRAYWTLPRAAAGAAAPVEALRRELETAVELRLISDVPLGVFLSGGVDSSAIAALAVRAAGPSVRTFSVGFEEAAYDESRHAEAVAKALGTDHTHILLTQRRFLASLDDALGSVDQPTFDQLNTYFVSRAVREAGITVALAGVGGDELFGGYATFRDLPRAARWTRALAPLPSAPLRALAGAFARWKLGAAGEVPPQVRWGKLADLLETGGDLVAAYQVHYALFTRELHAALLADPRAAAVEWGLASADLNRLRAGVDGERALHAISMLELDGFVGDRLLRDCDAASMSVGLELRVPLVDHRVVESVAGVDERERFAPLGRKRLLKQLALGAIDPATFERPKSGFVLPIAAWLEQELRDEVGGTLSDAGLCASVGLRPDAVGSLWRAFRAGAPGLYWSRVWGLYVLLWWCRRHRMTL